MSDWAQQRRENARLQAERLAERQAAESAQAQEHLKRFVASAKRAGLAPVPLTIRGFGGKGQARTPLLGWYLKVDQSLAVDTEGNFYLLIADLSLKDRMRGMTPRPSPPQLVLGKGGRDGEQMDLTDALARLLPEWRSN